VLLTSAVIPMAKAMIGEAYTALNNASAKLGIGDSTTAAAKDQTDLQAGSNKAYVGMDASYPQRTNETILFQTTAGPLVANYVWNEFLICDGSPGTAWCRFVQPMNGGVAKTSGQTWVLQVTLTMGRADAAN